MNNYGGRTRSFHNTTFSILNYSFARSAVPFCRASSSTGHSERPDLTAPKSRFAGTQTLATKDVPAYSTLFTGCQPLSGKPVLTGVEKAFELV
jgi:hypothetical protein